MLRSSTITRKAIFSTSTSTCWTPRLAICKGTRGHNGRSFTGLSAVEPDKNFPIEKKERNAPSGANATASGFVADETSATKKLNIYERLRLWEQENASSLNPQPKLSTISRPELPINATSRTGEEEFEVDSGSELRSDTNDDRQYLRCGDLVELISLGGQAQELAVFVRDLERQSQFYCMSGRWLVRDSQTAKFYIPGFVDPEELADVIPYLPFSEVSDSMKNVLQRLPQSVPKAVGKNVIDKMLAFWNKADKAYEASCYLIDSAHSRIASETRVTYATLEEIAEKVFLTTVHKQADGTFPKHILYALHRSLMSRDFGIKVQNKGVHRVGGQYEIASLNEAMTVTIVKDIVRQHQDYLTAKKKGNKVATHGLETISMLERFARRAREIIRLQRQKRDLTAYGTIGPTSPEKLSKKLLKTGSKRFIISDSDPLTSDPDDFGHLIRFLESWAGLESIGRHSSLNATGPAILRAIDMYPGLDLDRKLAWTFLKEIGVIAPWENQAPYNLRLPGTGQRLKLEDLSVASQQGFNASDCLKDIRKETERTIYCIDALSANEIDDGISIEATENPSEYWLHIHVADPAAYMDVNGKAAKYAEAAVSTLYMPERVIPMLESSVVSSLFSLGPNKPCLTFSAKMNLDGDLLEHSVTPAKARNVVYTTPSVVADITLPLKDEISSSKTYRVGPEIPPIKVTRPIMQQNEFSQLQKDELILINKIGTARLRQYRKKGGFLLIAGSNRDNPPAVYFQGDRLPVDTTPTNHIASHFYEQDPSIQVTTQHFDPNSVQEVSSELVTSCMLIAGEVAARWCNERGIPVAYRSTQLHPDKMSPLQFFEETIKPILDANGQPAYEDMSIFYRLLGAAVTTTQAAPHYAIGADMFTRATSPLRRYTDLMLHFQVEAALLEEARLGQSLIGNTREDFLPFSKAHIDDLLPRLNTRDLHLKAATKSAEKHWLLMFLLRAWHFKECEIPKRMPFVVWGVSHDLKGTLPTWNCGGTCELPAWAEESIQIGDVLEVEITDIDIYAQRVMVVAVGRYEQTKTFGLPNAKDEKIEERSSIAM